MSTRGDVAQLRPSAPSGPLPLTCTSPKLVAELRQLGRLYGAMGVAQAAAQLTDPATLVRILEAR